MKYGEGKWSTHKVNPLEVLLDGENPRIHTHPNASQEHLRHVLVSEENILHLAEKIASFGGMFRHEQIITVQDDQDRHIVLEGNRRICACQILLNPRLIADPDLFRQVPQIDSETEKAISEIPTCTASNREIADPLVANVHVESMKHAWGHFEKIKWAHGKISRQMAVGEIAVGLNIDENLVMTMVYHFKVYLGLSHMECWSPEEKEILINAKDVDLHVFLTIVTAPGTTKHFGESLFDQMGAAKSDAYLSSAIEKIARDSIFSQLTDNTRKVTFKTNRKDYLERTFSKQASPQTSLFPGESLTQPAHSGRTVISPGRAKPSSNTEPPQSPSLSNSDLQGQEVNGSATEGLPREKFRPRKATFFEDLSCEIGDDQRLSQLAKEISSISRVPGGIRFYNLTASLLMRALLEGSLKYHLKKIDKLKDVGPKQGDKRLSQILSFCEKKDNGVFSDRGIGRRISLIKSKWLDDLNANPHNDTGNFTEGRLIEIAGDVKPVVKHIFELHRVPLH